MHKSKLHFKTTGPMLPIGLFSNPSFMGLWKLSASGRLQSGTLSDNCKHPELLGAFKNRLKTGLFHTTRVITKCLQFACDL